MPPWVLCAADSGLPVHIGVGDLWGYPCRANLHLSHMVPWSVCPHSAQSSFALIWGQENSFLGTQKGKTAMDPKWVSLIWVFTHRKPIWSTQGMTYPKGQNCSRPCVLPGAHRMNVNLPFPTQPHVWQTWAWYWHRVHSGSSAGEYRALSCMCFCS